MTQFIWLYKIDLCEAKHMGLVNYYVCRKHYMKQAPWAWYVYIDSYLLNSGRCADPNLYLKRGPRYDFDFGLSCWWSTLDK